MGFYHSLQVSPMAPELKFVVDCIKNRTAFASCFHWGFKVQWWLGKTQAASGSAFLLRIILLLPRNWESVH